VADDADPPDRRGFLKLTTCALGGALGVGIVTPALRLFASPADEATVSTPKDPIDVGAAESFVLHEPTKVAILAPKLTDAWTSARDVVLGGAWVHRTGPQTLDVFSAVCPHLGCGIGFDGKQFVCPCHDSAFALDGKQQRGPSKRGLDTLAWTIVDGRLRITWTTFAADTAEKTPT